MLAQFSSLSKISTRLRQIVLSRKLFFDRYIRDKQQTSARRSSEKQRRRHINISINPEMNAIFRQIDLKISIFIIQLPVTTTYILIATGPTRNSKKEPQTI